MSSSTVPVRMILVGSVVVDVRLRVPALPERGGDLLASASSVSAGGGYYVLAAASRGGVRTAFAGRHGAGVFGGVVRSALRDLGVELAFGPDPQSDTGCCVVLVEPDGERTMITTTGVEAELSEQLLAAFEPRADDAVYLSGYDLAYPITGPAVVRWLAKVGREPLVVVDPGPLVADVPDDVLRPVLQRTDLLSLNVREATIMTGASNPAEVAAILAPRLAAGAVIVLRDGARGATLLEPGTTPRPLPARSLTVADSTGAGDTHTGALIAARAAGRDWAWAVSAANEAAADLLASQT